MNKVIIIGNLARDPEVRFTSGQNQIAVAHFSVAVRRKVSQNSSSSGTDVDFINCVAFGRTGENIGKFFTKGRRIAVSGRLQTNTWEDNNGQKRYSTDVIVEEFDFCDRKNGADNNTEDAEKEAPSF